MKEYPEDAEVLLAVDAECLEPWVANHIVTFGVPPKQVRILHTVWNRCTQLRKKGSFVSSLLDASGRGQIAGCCDHQCLPVCWDH